MKNFTKIFSDSRHFEIFLFAIFSGAPLAVLYRSLSGWLSFAGVDVAIITSFAISKVFYSMKFFWSPIIDQIKLPFLGRLGYRKSWMIVCLSFLSGLIFLLSRLDPVSQTSYMRLVAIAIGLASASFDIVFDAFRIEKLDKEEQAIGASNVVSGYYIGMFLGGGGILLLNEYVGWSMAFFYLSLFFLFGVFLLIFFASEPTFIRKKFEFNNLSSYRHALIEPFADFIKRDYAILMILAVISFKVGDAFLGIIAMPFYKDLGFTSAEIAYVTTMWGFGITLFGSYCCGFLMFKVGLLRAMIVTGLAQSLTNGSFIWLNHMGHDISAFTIAIAIENFASGMGNSALVAFLSSLCNRNFSATQYAFLTSAAGLVSHSIVTEGGWILKNIGYDLYFLMTILIAFPGIALFIYLNKKITTGEIKATA